MSTWVSGLGDTTTGGPIEAATMGPTLAQSSPQDPGDRTVAFGFPEGTRGYTIDWGAARLVPAAPMAGIATQMVVCPLIVPVLMRPALPTPPPAEPVPSRRSTGSRRAVPVGEAGASIRGEFLPPSPVPSIPPNPPVSLPDGAVPPNPPVPAVPANPTVTLPDTAVPPNPPVPPIPPNPTLP